MGASSHLYISRTVDTATLKGAGRYTPNMIQLISTYVVNNVDNLFIQCVNTYLVALS
jgi:hypothetical protein